MNRTRSLGMAMALLPVAACSSYGLGDRPGTPGAPSVAVNGKRQVYFPEARMRGNVAVHNGCVVIRRCGDGMLFTPVFPFGSSLARDGVRVNGAHAAFGRELAIGGGQVTLPDYSEVSLISLPPPNCPALIWVVGGLSKP